MHACRNQKWAVRKYKFRNLQTADFKYFSDQWTFRKLADLQFADQLFLYEQRARFFAVLPLVNSHIHNFSAYNKGLK